MTRVQGRHSKPRLLNMLESPTYLINIIIILIYEDSHNYSYHISRDAIPIVEFLNYFFYQVSKYIYTREGTSGSSTRIDMYQTIFLGV